MPVPQPKPGESQDEFIPRCVRTLSHIDKKRPQKQIVAICYGTWRNKGKKKESGDEKKNCTPEIVRKADEEIMAIFRETESGAWYKKPGQRPGIQKGEELSIDEAKKKLAKLLEEKIGACD
jgi:hypothetical protein